MPVCQSQASLQENVSSGQVGGLFTKGDAKYSGCHLYFSGDGSLPAGDTSSGSALQFCLRFSSSGASEISPVQFSELPQIGRHETNEASREKPREVPVVHETTSQYKIDKDILEAESLAGCRSRGSPVLNPKQLTQSDVCGYQSIHKKCDASDLSSGNKFFEVPETKKFETEDSPWKTIPKPPTTQNGTSHQYKIDNGVSTSVTSPIGCQTRKSDAPVSDIITKSDKNQQKNRRKSDARKLKAADIDHAIELSIAASEAMVISEMVSSSFPSDLLPTAAILEIALRVKQARTESYANVLEVTTVFKSDELDETDQLSDLDDDIMEDVFQDVGLSVTQIIETPENSCKHRKSPEQPQIMQSNSFSDLNRHVSESNSGCKGEAQRKRLKAQDPDNNITICKTNDFANELQSKELASGLPSLQQAKSSAFRKQSTTHTEQLIHNSNALTATHQATLKERGVNPDRDTNIKKTVKKFYCEETSFISESMDVEDQCPTEESAFDIVASSSSPFKDLSEGTYKEMEMNASETVISSQDIVRSSVVSSVDPLCSIVPCSIPLHDDPMKETKDKGVLDAMNTVTLKPSNQGVECVASKTSVEGSAVPNRKQFNSLKHYSMVIPCQKAAGGTYLFPTEQNTAHFASKKIESRLPLKLTENFLDVDGRTNSHDLRSKDHEEAEPSSIGERKEDHIGRSIDINEERCPPLVLNYKKRRHQACKMILNSDHEAGTLRKSSLRNMRKYRSDLTNEVSYKDQTTTSACFPEQSNLHSHPANEHRPLDKKVRFVEPKSTVDRSTTGGRSQSGYKTRSSYRRTEKKFESCLHYTAENGKEIHGKGMIFLGLDFLLTGLSSKREKEREELIRKHGGYVLSSIPPLLPDVMRKRMDTACLKLPIVLSPKKVQTTKFLYGCATNRWILNDNWLVDSVQAGSVLPPGKYTIRPMLASGMKCLRITDPPCLNDTFIFDRVGIMLHGKPSFCTKFSKIIKHGGGQVFKSLQRLVQSLKNDKNSVGVIVVENEYSVSRHLKHCAFEQSLQTMPLSWVVNSLFSGKLLPFKKDCCAPLRRIKMPTFSTAQATDMSQEI